ncbi:DNA polymerase III subunit delta [Ruixingdingia sedimenti]|uniref:DNA-directed DNA polymerase n=1 Tax=Ruixingdingia sedimenti TaxID=3073604 RepID=A0ABU1F694_9RHOB|nr:DNA polymerase III subunit delta [Xinfangfangia sp. LG-4]MDR5652392.1 DNA polymerase III subunit delta [Xinfangfangia sp. LG-4]
MKLSGTEAARYFARPDPGKAGLLIYGADAMRVALRRQQVIAALVGPQGEAEMRLVRMAAGDLRRDPAAAGDAMREQGFFPGPRVVFVEDANDTVAAPLASALADWRPGDAVLVVTAGSLTAKSALRKAFESAPHAYAVGLYDDPPSREEIEAELAQAGLKTIDRAAMGDLETLAKVLDPGDFRQTVEKIGLYKWGDDSPLTPEDIAACAPATIEAELDDLMHVVAEARLREIGPLMRRIEGQGINAVRICIDATRHFRTLHAAASDPGGPGAGLARARPPVFGPRRDRMQRQAQHWGMRRLESALAVLVETDLTLRSAAKAPDMALVERALIRLATLAR